MADPITGDDVRAAYDGFEGMLYERMMGELLHVGGLRSSLELAEKAAIGPGLRGVDLCCGNGASMRMLVKVVGVASMTGVEFSKRQVERTRSRTASAGLEDRIRLVHADACDSGLPDGAADFVWSEDAWCYVPDKTKLVAEAVRIARNGGTLAFTDWTLGPSPLTDAEREGLFAALKFSELWSADRYREALENLGCEIVEIADTGRFARSFDLYSEMFDQQLGWDVLQIADSTDPALLDVLNTQLTGIRDLGRAGKISQTRVIARVAA